MKPIMQNVFGDQGNCLSACIASLFETSIDVVPNFNEGVKEGTPQDDPESVTLFWAKVDAFLEQNHFGIIHFTPGIPIIKWLKGMKGYFIVGGKSPRGYNHAVIYTENGLAHDPHPEGGDVIAESVSIIYPLFDVVTKGKSE